MAKLLLCFKPMRDDSSRSGASVGQGYPDGVSTVTQDSHRHTVAYVELLKHSAEPLGLVLYGGKDFGIPVQVETIRPGGVAAKSGALVPGDLVLGINGVPTQHFTRAEVNSLLHSSGNVINLEIAFEAPQDPDVDDPTLKKTALINLPLENTQNNSYGFTISGGRTENRPITVSNVTLNTTAYRNGFLKAGDHILKVNDIDVTKASQMETIALLKSSGEMCNLEIQYDVPVHNVLNDAQGPMLVELLKPKGVSLGISLRRSSAGELKISRIKEAGIADRCGALHVGDCMVSLNGQSLEGQTVPDVYKLLKYCDLNVQLEILPAGSAVEEPQTFDDNESTVSRLPSFSSQLSRRPSQLSMSSAATSTHLTCHPEPMLVTLSADEIGFGLSLKGGATDYANYPITISSIEDGGPAARLGQLQADDRIVAINGIQVDNCTMQQAVKLVKESYNTIEMEVLFDVQDAIVPTSGTFEVTLVKTASLNFGITINGSKHPGEQIWIKRLKKGGVAYRTGMLHCGDILLAINGVSLDNVTLNQAGQMLMTAGEAVTLKVSKETGVYRDTQPAPVPETVVFSVELHRNQQSLGITLTGNKTEPGHPIVISKIKEDGVAYQTGTLKVGDSVLAINGESLVNCTLPAAVYMLQTAGDVVHLKIRKATSRPRRGRTTPLGRVYRPGFHRPSSMRGSSRLSSRMEGHESYSRLLALRARRLSQSTIGTVSGRSTPDNHSALSQSSYNGSFYAQQMEPSGRDSVLSRMTSSEYGSAFSRPNSVLSNSSRHRYNSYSAEPGNDSYYSTPPLTEAHQHMDQGYSPRVSTRLPSPMKDSRPETDEELSQYSQWEDNSSRQRTRRSSLPNQRPGRWDFKSRSYKPPKLIGRVSPLTPSEPPELTSNPPQIVANKSAPPSPVKDKPGSSATDDSEDTSTEELKDTSQDQESGEEVRRKPTEIQHSDSVVSSTGSTSVDTEKQEYGGGSSISVSQSTGNSPEPPPIQTTSMLACAAPVSQVEASEGDDWPQTDALPGYVESPVQEESRQSPGSPITSTVEVITSLPALTPSPSGSLKRGSHSPQARGSNTSMHRTELVTPSAASPTQSTLRVSPETLRRTSAPESVIMKVKHQDGLRSKSTSSFEPISTRQGYKETIQKANEFEKTLRALAESGSSDQDSDSEPHSSKPEEVTVREQEKIQEKMKATIPPGQLKVHRVAIKRKPGTSFGFSLADGCYERRIYVKAVKNGSPADKAGLLPFDIVLMIGDTTLHHDHTCETIDPLLKQNRDHLGLTIARRYPEQGVAGESYC